MNRKPAERLDRSRVLMKPLAQRRNRADIGRDGIDPAAAPVDPGPPAREALSEICARVRRARVLDRPVVMSFGAHAIKNGLGPVLISLLERGWVTHLAANGAGVIHDWEFSFIGQTSEDVRENVARGEFGNWEETGLYINLAINVGAYEGRGYGEAVGSLIENEGLQIPSLSQLTRECRDLAETDPEQAAAAADLAAIVRGFDLQPGWRPVRHPWKRCSVQAAAFRAGVPFTAHPMIGHDIIYNHPMNYGASIGRAALRDFLVFAASISRIEDGVYLSVGSAVMSPMIFEKSLSLAQNLALQEGRSIRNHSIIVVDLADSPWDWGKGEPPPENPAYYLRYNKTFSRMAGTLRYLKMDNRDFLLHLLHGLGESR